MYLKKINLVNFKSYGQFEAEFPSKIICFTGNNGVGKTNLLDAIYHFSYTKSFFNSIDVQNINYEFDFYVLHGEFVIRDKVESIYLGLRKGQKKILKRNGKEYPKLSDHIGLIPLVMVSPNDATLINEGSEERRRFIDIIISQFDREYFEALVHYNRALSQRNAILKENNSRSGDELLDLWDEPMLESGNLIFNRRQEFITGFLKEFSYYYQYISQLDENVSIKYNSQLFTASFRDLLISNRSKDKIMQYTTSGIHKDDLEFTIRGYLLKKNGSQGQQKTFLLALKLAQFGYIFKKCGIKPILLLDDIFDKLDHIRVQQLMNLVAENNFGQIFITDTSIVRIQSILDNVAVEYRILEISQ